MAMDVDQEIRTLKITKGWLEQYILVHNKSGTSHRDIKENLGILTRLSRSLGWINGVLANNAFKAQKLNAAEDLAPINVSANDELYHHNNPILSAICTTSLYSPLLLKVTI